MTSFIVRNQGVSALQLGSAPLPQTVAWLLNHYAGSWVLHGGPDPASLVIEVTTALGPVVGHPTQWLVSERSNASVLAVLSDDEFTLRYAPG